MSKRRKKRKRGPEWMDRHTRILTAHFAECAGGPAKPQRPKVSYLSRQPKGVG